MLTQVFQKFHINNVIFLQWTYDPFVADYNLGGGKAMAKATQEEMEME